MGCLLMRGWVGLWVGTHLKQADQDVDIQVVIAYSVYLNYTVLLRQHLGISYLESPTLGFINDMIYLGFLY